MAESGLVIVDKPGGMTSHDVVARIRRLAGTRRVGHAGTLDPMATGVLVIGVEKATRLLGYLTLTEKEYDGTIRLGQSTVTDDAEGEVLPAGEGLAADPATIPEAELRSALGAFVGKISQVPPRISAIKVDGKRAYRLTRSGAAPELAARPVTISRLDVLATRQAGEGLLDLDVAVTCSSGTYIRAIARDLGAALGTGGHLTALRRTRVGPYGIAAARTLGQLTERFEHIALAEAASAAFRSIRLNAEEARLVSHGGRLPAASHLRPVTGPAEGAAATGAGTAASSGEETAAVSGDESTAASGVPVAAFAPDGTLTALLVQQDGEMRPLAVFVP
ncbi:MAG: tRNA pseudouridine(55) synthase TruB [Nocardiopsaceae bacterium]|jgi:tRNA pseudouridine55 synthase|nr:tRNA pseudouridine(55) synthase TruB [Nocardiopsaceae bacterium]